MYFLVSNLVFNISCCYFVSKINYEGDFNHVRKFVFSCQKHFFMAAATLRNNFWKRHWP